MTERDSGFDSTGSTARAKRKIPAVTEVVEAVARRRTVAASERPALFQAAQHVCTDEIRLVRTGFAPSTADELADRAEKMLRSQPSGPPLVARWNENEPFGDLTVATGSTRRRPELSEELWPSKSEPPRPIRLPEGETPAEPATASRKALPREPARVRSERPIVSPPVRHSSRLPIFVLTFLALGGAAGYLFWKDRGPGHAARSNGESRYSVPVLAKTPRPSATAKPSPPALLPAPTLPVASARAAPTVRVAPSSSGETAPANQSRAGTMRSADWSGSPAFVLHCSSYKRRENAERDAARLSRLYGRPSHVLGVDLGSEGAWFRVVVGDFGNFDEAFAFRQKLLDEKASEVGLIYQVFPASGGA